MRSLYMLKIYEEENKSPVNIKSDLIFVTAPQIKFIRQIRGFF